MTIFKLCNYRKEKKNMLLLHIHTAERQIYLIQETDVLLWTLSKVNVLQMCRVFIPKFDNKQIMKQLTYV